MLIDVLQSISSVFDCAQIRLTFGQLSRDIGPVHSGACLSWACYQSMATNCVTRRSSKGQDVVKDCLLRGYELFSHKVQEVFDDNFVRLATWNGSA